MIWRCRSCGCLWRDNGDDTVSLASPSQKSCDACEHGTTDVACEPVFMLRAQDRTAPAVVRDWCHRARATGEVSEEKIESAMDCALEMEQWQKSNRMKWPD